MEGSGTTRNVVAWWNANSEHQIDYWGGDLRTGFNLLENNLPDRFDFVWIHPPYWNIIQYSQLPGELSNLPSYPVFRDALQVCIRRCSLALNPGGRLAVLVGDIRRQGQYTAIVRDVVSLEPELCQLRAIIIKAQHNCRSDSVRCGPMEDPRIQHEYCVVFKKVAPTMSGPHTS
jgi:tRNA1(Val) A37 N6-methylase TrmN6